MTFTQEQKDATKRLQAALDGPGRRIIAEFGHMHGPVELLDDIRIVTGLAASLISDMKPNTWAGV